MPKVALRAHRLGSGSSGSVVAAPPCIESRFSVLLREAVRHDTIANVEEAARWCENLGSRARLNFLARNPTALKGVLFF